MSLLNHEYTVRRLGQEPERHTLHDSAAIRRVLEEEFLLRMPVHAGLDRRLDELPK